MKPTRQSASNYYGFAITIEDSTAGDLASGGTTVPAPDSAKIYVSDGSTMLINGEDCEVDDNGDGTVNISYRPDISEVTVTARTDVRVQFFVKWPDVGGQDVEQWFETERVTLLPNLA